MLQVRLRLDQSHFGVDRAGPFRVIRHGIWLRIIPAALEVQGRRHSLELVVVAPANPGYRRSGATIPMDAVPSTQNCWAPECDYDQARGEYRLIWSSTVTGSASGDVWSHRIWSATTDFGTISAPALLFDPGYPVIDATVVHAGSCYFMMFKDERGINRLGTDYKAMRVATSDDGGGPFEVVPELITPHLTEGQQSSRPTVSGL